MQKQLKTLTTTAMGRGVYVLLAAMLFMVSCNGDGGDTAIIPIPKDTSALGKIDHFIPLAQINEYDSAFSRERNELAKLRPGLSIPFSEAFNKAALIDLLQIKDCVGIRIMYGIKQKGDSSSVRLILVGVNSKGESLYLTEQKKRSTANDAANQIKDAVPQGASGEVDGGIEQGQCYPPCHNY
jgi:hypothetical protein